MIYISDFEFPSSDEEFNFFLEIKRTCYDSFYPFNTLARKGLERLDFEPITILYGGNGSGKSTVLNVLAEKMEIERQAIFNKSNFFPDYVKLCGLGLEQPLPKGSQIITSDDVFEYMLSVRHINEDIDQKREQLFDDYLDIKYSNFKMNSIDDYQQLRRVNNARSKTQSKFVRSELMDNVRERSNGENAFKYFSEKIGKEGLYLLDEPENSLSPQRQIELMALIEEAACIDNCQFVIATHSPFLMAMKGAKIYDLDEVPVDVKRWTSLSTIRTYFDFFKKYESDFLNEF